MAVIFAKHAPESPWPREPPAPLRHGSGGFHMEFLINENELGLFRRANLVLERSDCIESSQERAIDRVILSVFVPSDV